MAPAFAQHPGKVDPRRAANMVGVGHQGVTAEMPGEDPLAHRNRLLLTHLAKAEGLPGRLAALDDKGRGIGVELIGMGPHPAVFGFLEDEGEGVVEGLTGAEPDELAGAYLDVGLEVLGIVLARPRVETISGQHQVEFAAQAVDGRLGNITLEAQFNATFAGSLLEQQQESVAPNAAETVAGGEALYAGVEHGDIIPIGEVLTNAPRTDGVVERQVVQRLAR